ncbi:MAG TPA: peptidase E [Gaiellaceae bacterium]|nr:peptidase E [Gaiellaceae bacterium]
MERHIIGLGGGGDTPEQTSVLHDYVLETIGKERPRLLYVPTAIADDAEGFARFHDSFGRRAELSHLRTFPWPPRDLRDVVLEQDGICVSGGNTANMLAIWRVHGIDRLMREAWESGVVLWGASAGMICWFEAGVTDSFGPQLEGMQCLGFLAGSACPHYDGEERRRPRYRELIDDGFPEGVAADDGAAIHYVGTEIAEVVSSRDGAAAYRVTRGGEERLETRLLA